jgi:ABC-type thiamin/hydroxymethylpyrimidine transport system permease subunit
MQLRQTQRLIDFALAGVWLVMGLYCKLLGQVPRHEAIVGEILGADTAIWLTPLIGIGEICLGVLIATGHYRKLTASIQILLVITMNILEFTFAVDHLLWGPLNSIFALLFCALVYWNAFILPKRSHVESN